MLPKGCRSYPWRGPSLDREYTKHYFVESQRITSKLGKGMQENLIDPYCEPLQGLQGDVSTIAQDLYENMFRINCSQRNLDITLSPGFEILQELTQIDEDEGDIYYYHGDHLGSSSWISNASGNVDQHLAYMPFGEDFINERHESDIRFKFTGKERDTETGFDYFGARYYASDLSVWLSVDPMAGKYPGMSAYMYCAGNPVVLVDPDGREIDEWNFNVNTGEMTWESNKGGEYRQYVNVIQNDKKIGETSVSGDKVFAYRLRDCVVVTNADREFNDKTYNANSGYSYSYEDFKVRNILFDNPSPISTAIQRSESNGKAVPLTYKEDVSRNGYTIMRLTMMGFAIENGMQVPSFANKTSFKKFGSSLTMTKTYSSSTLQGNSGAVALSGKRSWNLFLQANKGVYSGKGWQKIAAADYYKSDYYNP
jgi:RHS repeat-associated protein